MRTRTAIALVACIAAIPLTGVRAAAAQATLVVAPGATTVAVNGTEALHVEYDSDGADTSAGPEFQSLGVGWSSSDTAVATVSPRGSVTGVAAGVATITAEYQGMVATGTVTVNGTTGSYSIITPDGRTRTYLLYVPANYDASGPAPLVLNFHGGVGTSAIQQTMSQMNNVARQKGFLIAYPQGTGAIPTWNAGSCCAEAQRTGVDDVGFADAVIDHVDLTLGYNLDPRRVYATGFSNGGMLTHRLGCELSNRIAAIAPIGGGLTVGGDFAACEPQRRVPVMMFHGTTDKGYPYEGGRGELAGPFDPIPKTVDDWRRTNGLLDVDGRVTYAQGIVTCTTYAHAKDEVTLCKAEPPERLMGGPVPVEPAQQSYDGGGHAIPGGVRAVFRGDFPTADVDSSAKAWKFFVSHPMPIERLRDGRGPRSAS